MEKKNNWEKENMRICRRCDSYVLLNRETEEIKCPVCQRVKKVSDPALLSFVRLVSSVDLYLGMDEFFDRHFVPMMYLF